MTKKRSKGLVFILLLGVPAAFSFPLTLHAGYDEKEIGEIAGNRAHMRVLQHRTCQKLFSEGKESIMIDFTMHSEQLQHAIETARKQQILIPTFEEQKDPRRIDPRVTAKLRDVGLWDINSLNLFRVTWKNAPVKHAISQYPLVSMSFMVDSFTRLP